MSTHEEKPKRTRTRKPATPRTVALKIAALLDTLDADSRAKALELAKTLIES